MDRISSLPDDILCHILSFLPTKHAVATSVLSSRWVNLWSFVPIIDLDDSLYLNPSREEDPNSEHFVRFMDRVLSLNQCQTIAKFRLYMHGTKASHTLSEINEILYEFFWRDVVEIDLNIYSTFSDDDHYFYLEIPNSQSLEVFKVRAIYCLMMPTFPGCFPSLRVFDAEFEMAQEDDDVMTNLFACLPALEKLRLVGDLSTCFGEFSYNIGGPVLKHLELELFICNNDECDAMVVIDAPQLEYLRLQDTCLATYLVKHMPAISEVRLHVGEDKYLFREVGATRLTRFSELLQGLVNTKFISVSSSILKVIYSQNWNLPVLPYLTKLELEVPASSWMLLLDWLESCPNLKFLSLIIKEKDGEEFEEVERIVPDVVPSCLSSRIKEIKIKRLGKADEEEMLKYLLRNATVLDKFTIDS